MPITLTPASPFTTTPNDPQHEVEALGTAIAELSARLTAATYELLLLIREFDDRQGWSGFTSCAHWLSWRVGLGLVAAREKLRVAHALAALPLISEAMQRGEVSYSKIRAITRVASPETELALLDVARAGTAVHVERIVRAWRRVDRAAARQDDQRRHLHRGLQAWADDDGMVVIRARLSPEVGGVVLRALEAAGDRLRQGAPEAAAAVAGPPDANPAAGSTAGITAEVTAEQRRADALGLLAEAALAADLDAGHAGDRYQVVLHVEEKALRCQGEHGQATLEDPLTHASAEASRRIACDASVVVMRHDDDDQTLDVGRKRRTVPPAIRRALRARDGGCRFPGCPARRCDAHHVEHWADGGATSLSNLIQLCRRHHRAVHEEGVRVAVDAAGVATFSDADGRPIPTVPPTPSWSGPPLDSETRSDAGISIYADLATPAWRGERLDLEWAIDVLHPAARRGSHDTPSSSAGRASAESSISTAP